MHSKTITTLFVISIMLSGCATPGIIATAKDKSIEIAPIANKGILSWLFPTKLPAGKYKAKIDEKELEFDTKKDMKLMELDFNAVEQ